MSRMLEKAAAEYEEGNKKNAFAQYMAAATSIVYKLSSSKIAFQADESHSKLVQLFQLAHECMYNAENVMMGRRLDWRPAMHMQHDGMSLHVPPTAMERAPSTLSSSSFAANTDHYLQYEEIQLDMVHVDDDAVLPLVALSPLSRMYIVNTRRLAKATREYANAKKPSRDRNKPLAVSLQELRRLEEDVAIQRSNVDEVSVQIASVADKSLLSWDSDHLARQLCILDANLFAQVDTKKDFEPVRGLKEPRCFGTHVEACIDFERHVQAVVSHLMVMAVYEKIGAETLIKLIKTAGRLKDVYRDFNAFSGIVRALTSFPVRRLPRLWDKVPKKVRALAGDYLKVIEPERFYRRYMVALEEAIQDRHFELMGACGTIALPWMRAHTDCIRSLLNAFSEEKSVPDMVSKKKHTIVGLVDKCRLNVSSTPTMSTPAPPSSRKPRRKVYMDINGDKQHVLIPGDLMTLNADVVLQHWILSRLYLTKAQLVEESGQVKPMSQAEQAHHHADYSLPFVQMGEEAYDKMVSDAQEIRANWNDETPSTPVLKINRAPSPAGSHMSVDDMLDFLDESVLNIRGMHKPYVTPTSSPPRSPTPPPTQEMLARAEEATELTTQAREQVLRNLKPEFAQLREELENLNVRKEADMSPHKVRERIDMVHKELQRVRSREVIRPKPVDVRSVHSDAEIPWLEVPASPRPASLAADLSSRPMTPQTGTLAAELISVSRAESVLEDDLVDTLKDEVSEWVQKEAKHLQETTRQVAETVAVAEENLTQLERLRDELNATAHKEQDRANGSHLNSVLDDLMAIADTNNLDMQRTMDELNDKELTDASTSDGEAEQLDVTLDQLQSAMQEEEEEEDVAMVSLQDLMQLQATNSVSVVQPTSDSESVLEDDMVMLNVSLMDVEAAQASESKAEDKASNSDENSSARPFTPPREVSIEELVQLSTEPAMDDLHKSASSDRLLSTPVNFEVMEWAKEADKHNLPLPALVVDSIPHVPVTAIPFSTPIHPAESLLTPSLPIPFPDLDQSDGGSDFTDVSNVSDVRKKRRRRRRRSTTTKKEDVTA